MRTITRFIPYNSITTFRVSLESAGTGNLQTSPTLAAGDVKISKDGGAESNLNTLPAVDGTNTRQVNVTISATESSAGEVRILFADQTSPKEWDDLEIVCWTYGNASSLYPYWNDSRMANLDAAVSTRLAPTVNGRTLDVTATGEAGIDWANIGGPTTSVNLSGTTISTSQAVASVSGSVGSVTSGVTVTTNNDKTGYALSASAIQAIWDALTSALTTVGSIGKRIADNLDAAISSRLASASYTAPLDAAGTRSAVGLASANLDTQLTGINTNIDANETKIDTVDTVVDAIKAKTDSLTFTVAGQVDANIQSVNDVTVTGDGSPGNEWGP